MCGLWPHGTSARIVLSGTTMAGMDFSGALAGLNEETLTLQSSTGTTAQQVGIPLDSIDTLTLHSFMSGGELLTEMESCTPLLPYLSADALEAIMESVLPAAESWSWESLYLWAERLERHMKDPRHRMQASLKKLRALLELGDLPILESELQILKEAMDPVTAPAELCWINAEFLFRTGKNKEARFWAELPDLQVPPCREKMPNRLIAFLNDQEDGDTWGEFRK